MLPDDLITVEEVAKIAVVETVTAYRWAASWLLTTSSGPGASDSPAARSCRLSQTAASPEQGRGFPLLCLLANRCTF